MEVKVKEGQGRVGIVCTFLRHYLANHGTLDRHYGCLVVVVVLPVSTTTTVSNVESTFSAPLFHPERVFSAILSSTGRRPTR